MVNLTGEQVKAETLLFILSNINYQNNYLYYKYFDNYGIQVILNYIHLLDEIDSLLFLKNC